MKSDARMNGSLAIVAGAAAWGLTWIPLHHLNAAGIEGLWAVALVLGTPLPVLIPLLIWNKKLRFTKWYLTFGSIVGLSIVLYFGGVIFSDVIRVIFLFYMLPIWATLLSSLLYAEAISRRKLVAILIALLGLYLLLGGENGLPIPDNLGDWFGLASGFLWALGLVQIRENPQMDATANTLALFLFGAPIAVILALLLPAVSIPVPSTPPSGSQLLYAVPFSLVVGCLFLWPAMYGQIWGARLVSASTAALLTMSEILMATLSAWLLIGSTLTPLSILGGLLIVSAAILDLTATAATR